MAAEYAAGGTSPVLARKYGVTPSHILNVVRRAGTAVRTASQAAAPTAKARGVALRVMSANREAEAVRLYLGGLSSVEVAARLGVHKCTIQDAVRRQGGAIRNSRDSHLVYKVNEGAFDFEGHPSERAAYFAGLLMADGSVGIRPKTGEHSLKLTVAARDREIVELLRSFLQSTHPISDEMRLTFGKHRPCCSLRITSQKLVATLSRFGVVPNKTYSANAPEFLHDDRHFWRGCVDGDGWITQSHGAAVVGFCGARGLVEQFAGFCGRVTSSQVNVYREPRSEVTKKVIVSGRRAVRIIGELYEGCSVALRRKMHLAAASVPSTGHEHPHQR